MGVLKRWTLLTVLILYLPHNGDAKCNDDESPLWTTAGQECLRMQYGSTCRIYAVIYTPTLQ